MTAEPAAATGPSAKPESTRNRLNADERRKLILNAARKAFVETGDMSGTTIRTIALKAGISEGLIYRHFESKDQLYLEAVVEPLQEIVDRMIGTADSVREQGVERPTGKAGAVVMEDMYDGLVSALAEVLPLLGLVLFGDPKLAKTFYQQSFGAAMDRMAVAWDDAVEGHWDTEDSDVRVRLVMGASLLFALEDKYNPAFARERAVSAFSEVMTQAWFPTD